jgi:hypothetical protein
MSGYDDKTTLGLKRARLHVGMLFWAVGTSTPVYGGMQTNSNGHLLLLDS